MTTPKFDPALANVRNDSGLAPEKAAAVLNKSGVMIRYGDTGILVTREALAETKRRLDSLPPEERAFIMVNVDAALQRNIPKMESGELTKEITDECYGDLLIWEALRASRQ